VITEAFFSVYNAPCRNCLAAGLCPDPLGELECSPDPLAVLEGGDPGGEGKGGDGMERKGRRGVRRGRGKRWRGREGWEGAPDKLFSDADFEV